MRRVGARTFLVGDDDQQVAQIGCFRRFGRAIGGGLGQDRQKKLQRSVFGHLVQRVHLLVDPILDIGEPAIGDHTKPLLPALQFTLTLGFGELNDSENAGGGHRHKDNAGKDHANQGPPARLIAASHRIGQCGLLSSIH